MRRRTAHGARTISDGWLGRVGAPEHQRVSVTADVVSRLQDLPSVLGLLVRPVEGGAAVLPRAAIRSLCRLPGFSEYARLVESLTAVSYFDLVYRSETAYIPRQRTPSVPARAEQV